MLCTKSVYMIRCISLAHRYHCCICCKWQNEDVSKVASFLNAVSPHPLSGLGLPETCQFFALLPLSRSSCKKDSFCILFRASTCFFSSAFSSASSVSLAVDESTARAI